MKKKKSTLLIVGMSFLLSIGTLMFSSCADKDDPSPILPTPEDTSYILKLKFSEKVEFKEILNKNDIQDLTETETAYFGERIQWSYPHELQFDRDSLSIVKTNNIVEKYKLKWQDKKLFIYQKPIDKWEYCGEKDENGSNSVSAESKEAFCRGIERNGMVLHPSTHIALNEYNPIEIMKATLS